MHTLRNKHFLGLQKSVCVRRQKMSSLSLFLLPSRKCLLCRSQETHTSLEKHMYTLPLQEELLTSVSGRCLSCSQENVRVCVCARARASLGGRNSASLSVSFSPWRKSRGSGSRPPTRQEAGAPPCFNPRGGHRASSLQTSGLASSWRLGGPHHDPKG